mmetsp:Transcript_28971/g.46730  ORF Transcript_28971/g.46730 Transcript_28971/m.46730 type:complete len:1103 (+) Transcript_28971:14-3322(+)
MKRSLDKNAADRIVGSGPCGSLGGGPRSVYRSQIDGRGAGVLNEERSGVLMTLKAMEQNRKSKNRRVHVPSTGRQSRRLLVGNTGNDMKKKRQLLVARNLRPKAQCHRVVSKDEPESPSRVVFLIDVGTITDAGIENVYAAILKLLVSVQRKNCNKNALWGYRLFDSRSRVGCTPREIDQRLGKGERRRHFFRPVCEEEILKLHSMLLDKRLVMSGSNNESGSSQLSTYNIFQASVDQVMTQFNWDDFMFDERCAPWEQGGAMLVVVSPCPQSSDDVQRFISKGINYDPKKMPRGVQGILDQSLSFFVKHAKQYAAGLFWMDTCFDRPSSDLSGIKLIQNSLTNLGGSVFPLAAVVSIPGLLPMFPVLDAIIFRSQTTEKNRIFQFQHSPTRLSSPTTSPRFGPTTSSPLPLSPIFCPKKPTPQNMSPLFNTGTPPPMIKRQLSLDGDNSSTTAYKYLPGDLDGWDGDMLVPTAKFQHAMVLTVKITDCSEKKYRLRDTQKAVIKIQGDKLESVYIEDSLPATGHANEPNSTEPLVLEGEIKRAALPKGCLAGSEYNPTPHLYICSASTALSGPAFATLMVHLSNSQSYAFGTLKCRAGFRIKVLLIPVSKALAVVMPMLSAVTKANTLLCVNHENELTTLVERNPDGHGLVVSNANVLSSLLTGSGKVGFSSKKPARFTPSVDAYSSLEEECGKYFKGLANDWKQIIRKEDPVLNFKQKKNSEKICLDLLKSKLKEQVLNEDPATFESLLNKCNNELHGGIKEKMLHGALLLFIKKELAVSSIPDGDLETGQKCAYIRIRIKLLLNLLTRKRLAVKDPPNKQNTKKLNKLLMGLNMSSKRSEFQEFIRTDVIAPFSSMLPKAVEQICAKFECSVDDSTGKDDPIEETSTLEQSVKTPRVLPTAAAVNPSPDETTKIGGKYLVDTVIERVACTKKDPLALNVKKFALNHFTSNMSNLNVLLRKRKHATTAPPSVNRDTNKVDKATTPTASQMKKRHGSPVVSTSPNYEHVGETPSKKSRQGRNFPSHIEASPLVAKSPEVLKGVHIVGGSVCETPVRYSSDHNTVGETPQQRGRFGSLSDCTTRKRLFASPARPKKKTNINF